MYRHVKLDVWAKDTEETIYDTEPQQRDTKNLPRRSRYYQSMIDVKLLEPGEIDFNKLNNVFIIMIAPFDLFGYEKYMYTFQMSCKEQRGILLEDGAVRIFLNTHGKNDADVSLELVELLHYMEHTTDKQAEESGSSRMRQLRDNIESIKSSEEIGVKYMQEWEEKIMERQEAYAEGRTEGRTEGHAEMIMRSVTAYCKKHHTTVEEACEDLEFEIAEYEAAKGLLEENNE